jgi:hypothetical protein
MSILFSSIVDMEGYSYDYDIRKRIIIYSLRHRNDVNLVFQDKISVGIKLRICPSSIILEVVVFWNILLIWINWWVSLKKDNL